MTKKSKSLQDQLKANMTKLSSKWKHFYELPHETTWQGDGIDHININGNVATELGKALHRMTPLEFSHDFLGKFRSLNNLWDFVATGCRIPELRISQPARTMALLEKAEKIKIECFDYIFMDASWQRVQAYPALAQALYDSDLPFDHYATVGKLNLPERRRPVMLIVEANEIIRAAIQKGVEPDFTAYMDGKTREEIYAQFIPTQRVPVEMKNEGLMDKLRSSRPRPTQAIKEQPVVEVVAPSEDSSKNTTGLRFPATVVFLIKENGNGPLGEFPSLEDVATMVQTLDLNNIDYGKLQARTREFLGGIANAKISYATHKKTYDRSQGLWLINITVHKTGGVEMNTRMTELPATEASAIEKIPGAPDVVEVYGMDFVKGADGDYVSKEGHTLEPLSYGVDAQPTDESVVDASAACVSEAEVNQPEGDVTETVVDAVTGSTPELPAVFKTPQEQAALDAFIDWLEQGSLLALAEDLKERVVAHPYWNVDELVRYLKEHIVAEEVDAFCRDNNIFVSGNTLDTQVTA